MPEDSRNLLEVRGLTKRYSRNTVLDDVTFEIRPGEVLGLIGPNGAGKTTLFECVAGLIPIDSGEVRKSPLFYLPDGVRPWGDQRVEWVLGFYEQMNGSTATAAVDALQLQGLRRARIGTLSKGELKRFMLALALSTAEPLLLLDEPFDGLDLRQTREAMLLLRASVRESGRTLALSIHQLNDAARVCDRLILLSGGRVAGAGTLDELRAASGLPDASLEEVFLALT